MTQEDTGVDTKGNTVLRLRTNRVIRILGDFIVWSANELATNAAKYTGALTVAETTVYSDEYGGFRGAELGYIAEPNKEPDDYDIILLIHDSSPDSAVGQPDKTRDPDDGSGYGTAAVYGIATDRGRFPNESGKTVWVRFGSSDENLDT